MSLLRLFSISFRSFSIWVCEKVGQKLAQLKRFYYLCTRKPAHGTLAEWLGNGLQNRVQQFKSARYLLKPTETCRFFCTTI